MGIDRVRSSWLYYRAIVPGFLAIALQPLIQLLPHLDMGDLHSRMDIVALFRPPQEVLNLPFPNTVQTWSFRCVVGFSFPIVALPRADRPKILTTLILRQRERNPL